MNYKHNLTDIFSLGGIKTKNKYALPKSACQSILHHENAVALHTQGIKQLCWKDYVGIFIACSCRPHNAKEFGANPSPCQTTLWAYLSFLQCMALNCTLLLKAMRAFAFFLSCLPFFTCPAFFILSAITALSSIESEIQKAILLQNSLPFHDSQTFVPNFLVANSCTFPPMFRVRKQINLNFLAVRMYEQWAPCW